MEFGLGVTFDIRHMPPSKKSNRIIKNFLGTEVLDFCFDFLCVAFTNCSLRRGHFKKVKKL